MINMRKIMAAGALLAATQLTVADQLPTTVAVFDHGSLDTLTALGLQASVVGVPKQGLPDYLEQYNNVQYTDLGGLKDPDLEALTRIKPSYILITGRQAAKKADLEAISEVKQIDVSGENYWDAFRNNVKSVAALFDSETFDAQKESEAALEQLQKYILAQKSGIKDNPSVLVVTHNKGSFGLRNEPVITQLLGLSVPALPADVKSQTRGTRTFTPLTLENMVEMGPDALYIIDRSAAIGNTGEALNINQFTGQLSEKGGASINVVYLTPKLWYLSGNGLQSVRLQVKEVTDAL